jgi:hypothetical protein
MKSRTLCTWLFSNTSSQREAEKGAGAEVMAVILAVPAPRRRHVGGAAFQLFRGVKTMTWFRSRPSSARSTRVRPQLEALEDRCVPALSGFYIGNLPINNEYLWGVTLYTDGGNDWIEFRNKAGSGNGNVEASIMNNDSSEVDPQNAALNAALANTRVNFISVLDYGGRNTIYYRGQTETPVRYVDIHGGSGRDEFFASMEWALGAGQRIRFTADGREGDDTLKLTVQVGLKSNSELGVGFEGGNGFDNVSVDAWNWSPTIESGALLWMNLSGYKHDQLSSDNNGNNVSFWYRGRMDGTFLFNLMGSGRNDLVSVNFEFAAGSQGTVGNDSDSARIRGGGGDDDLQYIVKGTNTKITYKKHKVEGGSGTDTLTLATVETQDPRLVWSSTDISGIDRPFQRR